MEGAFSSARDRLGQTLCGKYQIESILGVGGTAVVYRAVHKNNGHRVAVKMLHEYLSTAGDIARRFMREGYLANMIDHPGTVRVLDDDVTEDGCPFLVLELLEGETLDERRDRMDGRLPLDEVLGIVDQLLSVLQTAHEKSVIHRDIKPSNLFLTREGSLRVLDFGIARLVDDGSPTATKTGTMIGTPAFMPPEQALSKPREVDAQSDLWSVGATMFTLISGDLVHVAESSSEHLVKAATMPARSIAMVVPGIPENVEKLVAKALSFQKHDRFASAEQMRQELWRARLEPGRPVGTPSMPVPARVASSNFPTVVTGGRVTGSRDSNGITKEGMSLAAKPIGSRRSAILSTAVIALVVAAGASGVVYGTMARERDATTIPSGASAGEGKTSPLAPSVAPVTKETSADANRDASSPTTTSNSGGAPSASAVVDTPAKPVATKVDAPKNNGAAKPVGKSTPTTHPTGKKPAADDPYRPF